MIYKKNGKLLVKDGKLCSTCCPLVCPDASNIQITLDGVVWCEACFSTGGFDDLVVPWAGQDDYSLVQETSEFCRYYWIDNISGIYRSNFKIYKTGPNRGKVFFDYHAHSAAPVTKWIFYKCSENPTAQNPAPNLYALGNCCNADGDYTVGGHSGTGAWSVT